MIFVRCLVVSAITLSLPSSAPAQLKRIDDAQTPGKSAAVIVLGDLPLLHTSQLLPVDSDNQLVGKDDVTAQTAFVLKQLKDTLLPHNVSLDQVVKLNLAAKTPEALETLEKMLAAAYGEHSPAITLIVSDLSHPDALVALDAIAALPANGRDTVNVRNHRTGILPAGQRIYISGQAEPGELLAATRKTMESLFKTLESLNLTKSAIVQVRAFVNPMTRASDVRQEIAKSFDSLPLPPIAFLDWKFDTPIEIEVVVAGGEARPGEPLDYITPPFMKSSPVFTRVVSINNGPIIYVSGMHGAGGTSPDDQITSIFEQLENTLKAAGSDLHHLAKATYFCTEPKTIKSLGSMRKKYYDPKRPPAASLVRISHTGRASTTITLDMIAVPNRRE